MRTALVCGLCALLVFVGGCFETTLSLGTEDDSKVNAAFCGNWTVTNEDKPDEKINLLIRNIDGKRYFVDWTNPSEKEEKNRTIRLVGYTAPVKGVTFAQVRDLPEDGSINLKHLVMRIEINKDGELIIRQLNESFFKDQAMQTDADFRRIVEDNLDNAAMYDEQPIVAKKTS